MKKIAPHGPWLPDYIAPSVHAIDLHALRALDITHLAFDLDDTLVTRRSNVLTNEDKAFLEGVRRLGFQIYIASNTLRTIETILQTIQAPAVRATLLSRKPFPGYYRRLIRATGTSPRHIAMVGDNIINDIYGANKAGLVTIFVLPQLRRHRFLSTHYINRAIKHEPICQ